MAVADLMVVIVVIILEKTNYIYLFAKFLLVTPTCSVLVVLNIATRDCSVWLTVAFTFDRCVAICCEKLRNRYCTERTAAVVIATVSAACCAWAVPIYFAVDRWRCVPTAEYITSPLWRAYEVFDSIRTPLIPICLILLFNVSTIKRIMETNRVRRELRKNSEYQKDPELANRRNSMILLFSLSANFILFWMPYVAHSMNWQPQNYTYTDRYFSKPTFILQQCGFMFSSLSMCTNTCIYGLTQRKFREQLKNGLKYLFDPAVEICK
ncbi:probable G-protein coupled receptor 139 [Hypanus sabinus]|uniref:probable G-protein coupled receptor 139 n=1 Tax=Hypanus sabinus TaxID=79690 RepID=UPI0028C3943C|nr:probable G-protein coupled receptor 139 [Hypanus sabinus]